ncbi:hypothetical protein PPERSA_07645 [Pseudocohnilembus persalinus]|uniref:PCI domain-containing protein n=1 Tax=Pseudocohnilembus persalinus TaxID=266149 RepID=A0A0V0QJ09_PSEPJ|nr:hypothetical protein PPERSA_07645 [Pseudocohnilembus persalinus]|eukprot:KRX02000.1 hypothetical protein PPERSA_07645 [Pseudocohnilembus persalinus]
MSIQIFEYAQLEDLVSLTDDIRKEADKKNQSIEEETEEDEYLNEFNEKYAELFQEEKYEDIIQELLALREKFFYEKTSLQTIVCCIFFASKIQNNEDIVKKLTKTIIESEHENINAKLNIQDLRNDLIIKYIQSFGNKEQLSQDDIKLVQQFLVILLSQNNIKLIPSTILHSQAFNQLKSSKLPIAFILEYFITGNLEQYISFESQNKEAIQKLGLDAKQISQFVRIKAIPQIVESGTIIQFKELAQSLKVSESEVEEWIILAIQYNLIEAQIDQFNASVNIISNDNKYFSSQDWKKLNEQLLNTIQKLKKQMK